MKNFLKVCTVIILVACIASFGYRFVKSKTQSSKDDTNTQTTQAEINNNDLGDDTTDTTQIEEPEIDTSDRTPETDRQEIKNNLKDAEELIENDMTDDAAAILRALKSRDLTEDEKAAVADLEAKMITITD